MSDSLFYFKQFSLHQEKSLMKITTDGVLLGAWANCTGVSSILDVGAGTGLITLMLAQRSDASVVAIEPDPASFQELSVNISESPWAGRIGHFPATFQNFLQDHIKTGLSGFDLIVSNPPYFTQNKLPDDLKKATARHTLTLSYKDLLSGVYHLLNADGRFCVIQPARNMSFFISLAAEYHMYCNRIVKVRPREGKKVSRVLLEFGKTKVPLKTDFLVIHNGIGYSDEYRSLTQAFYIHV